MKRIFTIIIAVLIGVSTYAQAPEKMSYQAVIRDGSNNLVTSTSVGMQISVLQGSVSGTAVYVETQTPTSNANGLISLQIGTGVLVSGDFSIIDWSNGPYYIKTETDPTGGVSYTISGTSQLLSVPYSLYSSITDSLRGFSPNQNNSFNMLVFSGNFSATEDTIQIVHNSDPALFVGHSFIYQEPNGKYNMNEEYCVSSGGTTSCSFKLEYWADDIYIYMINRLGSSFPFPGLAYKLSILLDN